MWRPESWPVFSLTFPHASSFKCLPPPQLLLCPLSTPLPHPILRRRLRPLPHPSSSWVQAVTLQILSLAIFSSQFISPNNFFSRFFLLSAFASSKARRRFMPKPPRRKLSFLLFFLTSFLPLHSSSH